MAEDSEVARRSTKDLSGLQLGLGDVDLADCVERSLAKEKRKKSFSVPAARAKQLDADADAMRLARDWANAEPGHLVSLWAWCYRAVYGVAPDLSARERASAHALAAKLVRDSFAGSAKDAVAFVRWTWAREKGREKWRRENRRSGSTLGWRFQFGSRQLLVEWQVDQRRTA